MGHHHHHYQSGHHDHGEIGSTGNLKVAFFLNLGFTIIELVGGWYTNSIAILSDALHDLGDSFSLGLAWYFQYLSKKGRTANFSYGYKRFSVLGATINSMILLVGCTLILVEAIPRIISPAGLEPKADGMILLALLGIVVNGAAALRLRKGSSINERVVSLHLLEDVLGWVAVLIGAIIMYFYDLPVIDPILSVLISGYVLYNVFKALRETMKIMLQGTPENINLQEVQECLKSEEAVQEIHDLHMWSLDGNYTILTVHLVVKDSVTLEDTEELKQNVRDRLSDLHIMHATIEIERLSDECSHDPGLENENADDNPDQSNDHHQH